MIRRLRIYAEQECLDLSEDEHHVFMLYPYAGKNADDRFETYTQMANQLFEVVDLERADLIIACPDWSISEAGREQIRKLAESASPEKPIVIFFWSDSDEPVDVPSSVVFRTSLYKSTQKPNEFAMPSWGHDYVGEHYNGMIPIRQKQEKPVIGFCGYAIRPWKAFTLTVTDWMRLLRYGPTQLKRMRHDRRFHIFRARLLELLERSARVTTNFDVQKLFLGRSVTNREERRRAFFENILNSDYTLCVRGTGNYSYRLYETLSCGRIPVFVNTDCVLPYDFTLNWREFCVWVEEKDVNRIDQIVADFHSQLSPDEFVALQQKCRAVWEDYIAPHGFFKQFWRHFTTIPERSTE